MTSIQENRSWERQLEEIVDWRNSIIQLIREEASLPIETWTLDRSHTEFFICSKRFLRSAAKLIFGFWKNYIWSLKLKFHPNLSTIRKCFFKARVSIWLRTFQINQRKWDWRRRKRKFEPVETVFPFLWPFSAFCQYLMVSVWSGSYKKLPPVTFYHTPDRVRSIEGIMAEKNPKERISFWERIWFVNC